MYTFSTEKCKELKSSDLDSGSQRCKKEKSATKKEEKV
jgi:hypothetical protein